MKAIVVTDQAAGTAGMKLVERPEPQGAVARRVVAAWPCNRNRQSVNGQEEWIDKNEKHPYRRRRVVHY